MYMEKDVAEWLRDLENNWWNKWKGETPKHRNKNWINGMMNF